MKKIFTASALVISMFFSFETAAQKDGAPASCKMYMDGKVIPEVSLEDAVRWCELVPPTVQCDDGKIYSLETFQVNFFTLKPLQNREFGTGEGGFPILAREAIAKGMPGDAIVLKEVTYTGSDGKKGSLPVISLKIK